MNATFIDPLFPKECNTTPQMHFIAVDSRYRDKGKYPDPNEFAVDIDPVFKNVVSIELVYAVYDKLGTEQYVNLCINEIDSYLVSNNSSIEGAFTQLPLTKPLNEYTSQKFRSIYVFPNPMAKIGGW